MYSLLICVNRIAHSCVKLVRMRTGAVQEYTKVYGQLWADLYYSSARCMHGVRFGMEVEKVGRCAVIHMKMGENRLNPDFIAAFQEALDQTEA